MLIRLIATLALFFAAPALAQRAPAGPDWTKSVTALPNGAFLLGNPGAPRLVEYFSYICSHCGEFSAAPTRELKAGWISSGKLAIEYRNYLLHPLEMPIALLARCGGAQKFQANHEAIFANYDAMMKSLSDYTTALQKDAASRQRDTTAIYIELADKTGLTQLVGKNGISADAAHQCLANKNSVATISALTASAWDADREFEGTPTFLLGDKLLKGIHGWMGLKPLLPPLPAPAN